MSVLASVLVPAGDAVIKSATLATTTSTAEIVLGKNSIFAINADKDVSIKFGNTGMGAAAATDYRIPANQQTTFDTSDYYTSVRVFNMDGAATANVSIIKLCRS